MPNKLMGYAAINNETRRDSTMLENALVAALDDAGDKLLSGAITNFPLRLIASAPGALDLTQQVLGVRPILNISVHRNNYYHYSSPPCSVSNCPA